MPALKRSAGMIGLLLFVLGLAPAKTLDTCFSPLGHCDQVLTSWINASEKTLDGAIYGLTDPDIAAAFVRAKKRGVHVRLIEDRTQARGKRNALPPIRNAGIAVRVQNGSGGGIQHNKFLIIDSKYVVTGSFNWTVNAVEKNDENLVVLDDEAARFEPEFERLWSGAKVIRKRKRRSYG